MKLTFLQYLAEMQLTEAKTWNVQYRKVTSLSDAYIKDAVKYLKDSIVGVDITVDKLENSNNIKPILDLLSHGKLTALNIEDTVITEETVDSWLKARLDKSKDMIKNSKIYSECLNQVACSVVFDAYQLFEELFDDEIIFDTSIVKDKLLKYIYAESDGIKGFFPLKDPVSGKNIYPSIHIVPYSEIDGKTPQRFKMCTTAMATVNAEIVFNKSFCKALIRYGRATKITSSSSALVSNGGNIPDEYAYIQFLIMHELLHFKQGDIFYGKHMGLDNAPQNIAADLIINHNLVQAGYEQLPIGIFNSKLNGDNYSMHELYEIAKRDIDLQQKNQPKKRVEKIKVTIGKNRNGKPPSPLDPDVIYEIEEVKIKDDDGNEDEITPPSPPSPSNVTDPDNLLPKTDQHQNEELNDNTTDTNGGTSGEGEEGEEGEESDGKGGTSGEGEESDGTSGESDGKGGTSEEGDGKGGEGEESDGKGGTSGEGEESDGTSGKDGKDGKGRGNSDELDDPNITNVDNAVKQRIKDAIDKATKEISEAMKKRGKIGNEGITPANVDAKANEAKNSGKNSSKNSTTIDRLRNAMNRKAKGNSKSQQLDKNYTPVYDWKKLLSNMLTVGVRKTTSYAKINRRKAGQTLQQIELNGIGALKPGEVEYKDDKKNILFIIDNSGSVISELNKVYVDLLKLVKDHSNTLDKFYILKFDSSWDFSVIDTDNFTFTTIPSNLTNANSIINEEFDSKSKSKSKPMKAVFTGGFGGGTNFRKEFIDISIGLHKKNFNTVVFTDTDVLEGENLKNIQRLNQKMKKHVGAFSIIFDTIHSFRIAMKHLHGKNISCLGLDKQ